MWSSSGNNNLDRGGFHRLHACPGTALVHPSAQTRTPHFVPLPCDRRCSGRSRMRPAMATATYLTVSARACPATPLGRGRERSLQAARPRANMARMVATARAASSCTPASPSRTSSCPRSRRSTFRLLAPAAPSAPRTAKPPSDTRQRRCRPSRLPPRGPPPCLPPRAGRLRLSAK